MHLIQGNQVIYGVGGRIQDTKGSLVSCRTAGETEIFKEIMLISQEDQIIKGGNADQSGRQISQGGQMNQEGQGKPRQDVTVISKRRFTVCGLLVNWSSALVKGENQ
jgi:hypothetical protein